MTLIDLHPDAEIGPGLVICHGGPVRIHGDTRLGADCAIHGVCTIGAGPRPGGAVIGDHVMIGCHASIIGSVTIGDGASVAANSLVVNDVPAGCVAIGVPAKTLPLVFRIDSSATIAPSAQSDKETLGLLPYDHSQIADVGEVSAPSCVALASTNDPEAAKSALDTEAISHMPLTSNGPHIARPRSKSTTRLKRQRDRQPVVLKADIVQPVDLPAYGLALNVAKCLKQSGHINHTSQISPTLRDSELSRGFFDSTANGNSLPR